MPGRESTGPVSVYSGKTWLYTAETQGETKEQFLNEVISVREIDIWKRVVGFPVGGYLEWKLLNGRFYFGQQFGFMLPWRSRGILLFMS